MNRPIANAAAFLTPSRCLRFAVAAMVLYVGWLILAPFPHYLPPEFDRGFLVGKESYFYSSGYFIGFYAHIASAPIVLLCGTLQMSRTLRTRWPRTHHRIGRVYIALMLCLVAPGGAIMSLRAFGGTSSTICFALISLLAWYFTFIAWRRAVAGRYLAHGRWMIRSYLMLVSAIALRLVHFALQPLDLNPTLTYQTAAWLSWVPALLILESIFWIKPLTTNRSNVVLQESRST